MAMIIPPVNESGEFEEPSKIEGYARVKSSGHGWRFSLQRSSIGGQVKISSDHCGLVRNILWIPEAAYFEKQVWLEGVGLTESASLNREEIFSCRTMLAAGKIEKQDLLGLFAALPDEFIPVGASLKLATVEMRKGLASLTSGENVEGLNARFEIDRANGWLSLTSNTDGEGETLEAVMWKMKNGGRLLALMLRGWSAGPSHTKALRVAEYRDGKFRHVTTMLPLPSEGEFYTPEEAAKRPPGGLIEGLWMLPRKGTTIVIRPPNEEAADLMPESEKSEESYFFELLWNGQRFDSVRLPRIIPAGSLEPEEWAFQSTGNVPMALFLKRSGAELKGEMVRPGEVLPVTGTLDADGQDIALTVGGKKAGPARLSDSGNSHSPWNALTLSGDFAGDEEISFEAIPREPEAPILPRYRIQGRGGVSFPQFTSTAPGWKAINARLAAIAEREKKSYKAAKKTATEDDPAFLDVSFSIEGCRENTVSILVKALSYTGGPHGQQSNVAVNYDFAGKRFLELSDVITQKEDWQAKLAEMMNKILIDKGDLEEGQELVRPGDLKSIPWTLDPPNDLTFHIAPESLTPQNVEEEITLSWESLQDAGLIRSGGPLDPNRK